jgi:hypothetical protein
MFTAENVLAQIPTHSHNQTMRVLFAFQLLGSPQADKIEVLENFNTVILTKSLSGVSNSSNLFDLRRSQRYLVNRRTHGKTETKQVIFSIT